ncbi:hypothetical protein OKW50_008262 [Paraburkholderia youngii]
MVQIAPRLSDRHDDGTGSRPHERNRDMDRTKTNSFALAVSRRTFLHSLGALALSACGGGGSVGEAAVSRSAVARAASINTASLVLARAATGEAAVATSGTFVHPGLLHTQTDFDRMAQKVAAQAQPWYAGFQVLTANGHTRLSWSPRPAAQINRGGTGPQNYPQLYGDIAAAYACALYWKVTGDTAYADKAVQIMNAWSSTLQSLGGDTNVDLAAGLYGYEFAIVGEIMRSYPGLAAADFMAFQSMMSNIFYPINIDFLNRHNNTDYAHYWANWDLCSMASIMGIGVLCDDRAMFDEAVNYYLSGLGNGAIAQAVYYLHPGYLGQWQESGRDQGHNNLGIGLCGAICEMAWNQGIDLYSYDNNRFLAGAEYVAKANLIQADGTYLTVPYESYANVDVVQPGFSTASQGDIRPIWALVYNHYVNRKGLAAPWSEKFALAIQPEGGGGNYGTTSGGYDQLGYGTLAYTRDPVTPAAAPSGVTALAGGGAGGAVVVGRGEWHELQRQARREFGRPVHDRRERHHRRADLYRQPAGRRVVLRRQRDDGSGRERELERGRRGDGRAVAYLAELRRVERHDRG